MVKIVWLQEARNDLRDIYDFISRDSERYAHLLIDKIYQRTQILTHHIRAGKIVEELNKEEVRELVEGRYRIIYRIQDENIVHILMIHHSARDLTKRIEGA